MNSILGIRKLLTSRPCVDCGKSANVLFNDPRTPPIYLSCCVCQECLVGIFEEQIDDLEDQLTELRRLRRKHVRCLKR